MVCGCGCCGVEAYSSRKVQAAVVMGQGLSRSGSHDLIKKATSLLPGALSEARKRLPVLSITMITYVSHLLLFRHQNFSPGYITSTIPNLRPAAHLLQIPTQNQHSHKMPHVTNTMAGVGAGAGYGQDGKKKLSIFCSYIPMSLSMSLLPLLSVFFPVILRMTYTPCPASR
jgi:hypothetical protein